MSRRDRWLDLALSAVLAVVVLGPLLVERGFALRGDMVLVPHQPWKDAWLALDGSAPRFVPGDAVLWALTAVVPGDLVQKALLLGAWLLGGAGAGRLVADRGRPARAAAVVLFTWNPWVLERLSIGQWGSVVGYAALPWVVLAAAAVRDGPRRWPALVLALGFSALWSPAAGMLAAATALCVVLVGRRLRALLVTAGAAVVVNLPWLVPSLVGGVRITAPDDQFAAFAARAESSAGLAASLLSLGGIWKTSVVPGERTALVVVLLSCLTTVIALVGVWRLRRDPTVRGLALLAGLVLLVVAVPALPGGASAADDAAARVPGLGALRDGHRLLGAAVLVLLPGLAAVVDGLVAAARRGLPALHAVAALVVVLPAVCLPSMAWGLAGQLHPVTYPAEWDRAAGAVAADLAERGGSTVVLPWHGTYRGFDWNARRAQLDPAPRYFAGPVLIDDRVFLGDRVLGHEDPHLAAVTQALGEPDPAAALRALGVARVVIEEQRGDDTVPPVAERVLHEGPGLTVLALADPVSTGPAGPGAAQRGVVLAGDVLTALALLVALAGLACRPVYGVPAVTSGRGTP